MCGPSAAALHCRRSAPSRRTAPDSGCQAPTSKRARVDLPEPDGPITPSASPGSRAKPRSCNNACSRPGAAAQSRSTRNAPRGRQRHAQGSRRILLEQPRQPLVGLPCAAPLAPDRDQLVDGAEHAAHQDRAGDHHPWGDQAFHRQPGAEAEHQRLQGQAHALGGRADRRAALAAEVLPGKEGLVLGEPARAHGRQHAHCRQGFRLAQVGRGLLGGEDRQLPGLGQRFARAAFVDPGEQHQQRPGQGEQAEPGTEEEDHQQVEREPGRVEEANRALPVRNWRRLVRSFSACPAACSPRSRLARKEAS